MKQALLLLLLFPVAAHSQKIKINEFDKFVKQQRVETEPLTILSSPDTKVALTFKSVGNKLFVVLSGFGWGTSTISEQDQAILLLDNDSTIRLTSTGIQSYNINDINNRYKHQYLISLADMETLTKHELIGIRKYNIQDYAETKIAKKFAPDIKKLSSLFLQEIKLKKNI